VRTADEANENEKLRIVPVWLRADTEDELAVTTVDPIRIVFDDLPIDSIYPFESIQSMKTSFKRTCLGAEPRCSCWMRLVSARQPGTTSEQT